MTKCITQLKFTIFGSLVTLLLFSCSSVDSSKFRLKTSFSDKILNQGDTLSFELLNPKQIEIDHLTFSLNNQSVDSPVVIDQQLGSYTLVASFSVNDKKINLSKKINVFASSPPEIYGYELVNTFPHDINAYTQGLEFHEGVLYESTGQYGQSSLRKVDFKTGEILDKLPLDDSYFGEGLTIMNDKMIQLTWKSNVGFEYQIEDFKLLRTFNYQNSREGWGACNDGSYIYKTDGSEKLWLLNPDDFNEIKYRQIVTHNKFITKVNELEFVDGLIYGNTYQSKKDVVVIIDPSVGTVIGVVNFSGLKKRVTQHHNLDVFNGIAYHPERKTFFVTGKYWDKMFEVKIIKK